MVDTLLVQAIKALAYYASLIVLMRFAGKRLAGQTTTFDLLVLITLGVVLQSTFLQPGLPTAAVFIATVFIAHIGLAALCARHTWLRHLVRGKPRALVENGMVNKRALERENVSLEELLAGLRKLGFEGPERVKHAVLEETGHISAIEREPGAQPARADKN